MRRANVHGPSFSPSSLEHPRRKQLVLLGLALRASLRRARVRESGRPQPPPALPARRARRRGAERRWEPVRRRGASAASAAAGIARWLRRAHRSRALADRRHLIRRSCRLHPSHARGDLADGEARIGLERRERIRELGRVRKAARRIARRARAGAPRRGRAASRGGSPGARRPCSRGSRGGSRAVRRPGKSGRFRRISASTVARLKRSAR